MTLTVAFNNTFVVLSHYNFIVIKPNFDRIWLVSSTVKRICYHEQTNQYDFVGTFADFNTFGLQPRHHTTCVRPRL